MLNSLMELTLRIVVNELPRALLADKMKQHEAVVV